MRQRSCRSPFLTGSQIATLHLFTCMHSTAVALEHRCTETVLKVRRS